MVPVFGYVANTKQRGALRKKGACSTAGRCDTRYLERIAQYVDLNLPPRGGGAGGVVEFEPILTPNTQMDMLTYPYPNPNLFQAAPPPEMPFKNVHMQLVVGAEEHQVHKPALISVYGKNIYGEVVLTDKFDDLFGDKTITITLFDEVSKP